MLKFLAPNTEGIINQRQQNQSINHKQRPSHDLSECIVCGNLIELTQVVYGGKDAAKNSYPDEDISQMPQQYFSVFLDFCTGFDKIFPFPENKFLKYSR